MTNKFDNIIYIFFTLLYIYNYFSLFIILMRKKYNNMKLKILLYKNSFYNSSIKILL